MSFGVGQHLTFCKQRSPADVWQGIAPFLSMLLACLTHTPFQLPSQPQCFTVRLTDYLARVITVSRVQSPTALTQEACRIERALLGAVGT